MKKFCILLFAFCFCSYANAQNTFERWYDTLGVQGANCVQETFDGGYVVSGVRWDNINMNNDAAIMKLDSLGNIIWVKTYGGPGNDGANHMEQTPDSGYIVYGAYDGGLNTQGWLLRLDANGDTIWTQLLSLGPQKIEPSRMCVDTGGHALTGYYQKPVGPIRAYLTKTTNTGSIVWSQFDYGNMPSVGYCVQPTLDSGYIITGEANIGMPVGDDVFLIKTNSIGDTLWTKKIGGAQRDIGNFAIPTSDSGYAIVGMTFYSQIASFVTYIIKTNAVGDTLWTRTYCDSVGSGGNCIKQTKNGGFVITGTIAVAPNNYGDLFIIKTDGLGNLIWIKKYGGAMPDGGLFVSETKDGGFIITGLTSSFGSGPGYKTYLIKTDSSGNVYYTGISAPSELHKNLLVYPNPSNGIFNLKMDNYNSSITFEIYNLIGNKIYSNSPTKSGTTHHAVINIASQPAGIYVLRVLTPLCIYSQKIIVQH